MKELKVEVNSPSGLHARPAAILVKEMSQVKSTVKLLKNDKSFDMKSMLAVLSAGISSGEEVTIQIDGEDEDHVSQLLSVILKERLQHV